MYKMQYFRMERPGTDSWMTTFKLDKPIDPTMGDDEVVALLAQLLPGWEWNGMASLHDPDHDGEDPTFIEPWRFPEWNERVWVIPTRA